MRKRVALLGMTLVGLLAMAAQAEIKARSNPAGKTNLRIIDNGPSPTGKGEVVTVTGTAANGQPILGAGIVDKGSGGNLSGDVICYEVDQEGRQKKGPGHREWKVKLADANEANNDENEQDPDDDSVGTMRAIDSQGGLGPVIHLVN